MAPSILRSSAALGISVLAFPELAYVPGDCISHGDLRRRGWTYRTKLVPLTYDT